MTSISIIMATARDNYPIIGQPKLHMLKPTIDSLRTQSFKEFEFICADALYNKRPRLFHGDPFNSDKLPFRVKHIPIHKDHRFWIDRKQWNVCGQLNTALMHCQGELIVRIDDCCEFDSDFIKKFWDGYQCGYFPGAMHIRYLEGKPATLNDKYRNVGYELNYWKHLENRSIRDKQLKDIFGENGLIRDTRYEIVKRNGGVMVGPHNWHYGYSSMSLEAALKINGLDENFDSTKSLEDIDCGSRLEMAGYKDKFMMDVNHQVIEHEHGALAGDLFNTDAKPIKCNYALYLLNRKKNRYRANTGKMSGDDIDFVRQESLRVPCTPEEVYKQNEHFYDEDCMGSMFETWMFRQPVFDLKEERKKTIEPEI
jgi:hypothetical protein